MSKRYSLCSNNISLYKENNYTFSQEEIIKNYNLEGIVIYVNIGDEREFNSLLNNYKAKPKKLHTYIDFVNGYTEGIAHTPENAHLQFVSLMLKKDYLLEVLPKTKGSKKLFDFLDKKTSIKNFSHSKINPKTQSLAKEILSTPYNDILDKLYIEAKALELIHTELKLNFYDKEPQEEIIKLSKLDKEAIYHAKDILMKNISQPPSLKELSRQVKINEFKLKIGFNKFFQQSPYSISVEYRLQKAKELLETSEYNINEIALYVGYKYPQSFSNAFYKKFGIRPKELMKNRKYYY